MNKDSHLENESKGQTVRASVSPSWAEHLGVSVEELGAWSTVLQASIALLARVESDVHRATGLTPFEVHFLGAVESEGGDVPMSRAAHLVDSSLSRLSHVVRRLEARGWVERRTSEIDARVTLVSLTGEGRERLHAAIPAYRQVMDATFLDHLDEDRRDQLQQAVGVLLGALRPGHWLFDEPEGGGGAPGAVPAAPRAS